MSPAILVYQYQGHIDKDLGRFVVDGTHLLGYVREGLVFRDEEDAPVTMSEDQVDGGAFIGSVTEDGRLFKASRGAPPRRGVGEQVGTASYWSAHYGTERDASFEIQGPVGVYRTVHRMVDQGDYFTREEWGFVQGLPPYEEGGGNTPEGIGAVHLINAVLR